MANPSELPARISPLSQGPQFFWSVMIPCYNPKPDYLEQMLCSVLQQDPGRSVMQVEVIDDCSPNGAPTDLVRKIAGDRVTAYREPKNIGLAGIWNRCIERARGEWVHILHQDDLVLPGFYEKLIAGTNSPCVPGLIYCRHAFIDEQGRQSWVSNIDMEKPGLLSQPLQHLTRSQMIQTPAVLVRRSVYEVLGGFRSDLCFALDWEMWCRVAKQFPVWYEPEILACYRVHSAAATSRLMFEGRDIKDLRKCITLITGYLPNLTIGTQVKRFALKRYALQALENGRRLLAMKEFMAAFRQIRGALMCSVCPSVLKQVLFVLAGAVMQISGSASFQKNRRIVVKKQSVASSSSHS